MRQNISAILAKAALDKSPVAGWTHNFYRYPARFSPRFAAAAIECFSRPSDLVLDPYMGGGTVVVEAVAAGRKVIGNDLNSLATFIAKVKITPLVVSEICAIRDWASMDVPQFSYFDPVENIKEFLDRARMRNLELVRARFIKKIVAAALASIIRLPTKNSRDFARCAVLRAAQWALDGRKRHTPLRDFRANLSAMSTQMLEANQRLSRRIRSNDASATLLNLDAATLDKSPIFGQEAKRVSLVVTSPPYPGVHVLYHRWQVDGRRETPAPYWIAGCNDGQGASFYNFADRRESAADSYFEKSLLTLKSIRRVLSDGAYVVQLVAFNKPEEQLQRYLQNLNMAGFTELRYSTSRIWREVPNRKWHAALKGRTNSSREVVLVHRAT